MTWDVRTVPVNIVYPLVKTICVLEEKITFLNRKIVKMEWFFSSFWQYVWRIHDAEAFCHWRIHDAETF